MHRRFKVAALAAAVFLGTGWGAIGHAAQATVPSSTIAFNALQHRSIAPASSPSEKLVAAIQKEFVASNPNVSNPDDDFEINLLLLRSNVILIEYLNRDPSGEMAESFYRPMKAYSDSFAQADLDEAMAALDILLSGYTANDFESLGWLIPMIEDLKIWLLIDQLSTEQFIDLLSGPMKPNDFEKLLRDELSTMTGEKTKTPGEMIELLKNGGKESANGGSANGGSPGSIGVGTAKGSLSNAISCLQGGAASGSSAIKTPGGGIVDPPGTDQVSTHGNPGNGPKPTDPTQEQWVADQAHARGNDLSAGYGNLFGKCGSAVDPAKASNGWQKKKAASEQKVKELSAKEKSSRERAEIARMARAELAKIQQEQKKQLEEFLKNADEKAKIDAEAKKKADADVAKAKKDAETAAAAAKKAEEAATAAKAEAAKAKAALDAANKAKAAAEKGGGTFDRPESDGATSCANGDALATCMGWSGGNASSGSLPGECKVRARMNKANPPDIDYGPGGGVDCPTPGGVPMILNDFIKDPPPTMTSFGARISTSILGIVKNGDRP